MTVPAIILAAGASRRLGQPKQLLKYCGETLLERALRVAKEAGATPVVVLLGAHFKRIRAMIPFNDAIPVLNDKWEKGLSSSIHAGLHELDVRAPDAPGVLVMSCDQPRLTANHLRGLLASFAAQPTPSIVASSYSGAQGVPAIFPHSVFSDLHALRGDKGARSLLVQPPCPVIALPFEGGEFDIDIPDDLAQLE